MSDLRRLDTELVTRQLAATRSQAENYIRMQLVSVNGKIVTKPGTKVSESDKVRLLTKESYVSRAGYKLASIAQSLNLSFKDKTVLDVGSSTGGFTDYALQHGAKKVFAVDVGTNQLHPSLRGNPQIELHEQTDIREFSTTEHIDYIVVDVSFISLREILPSLIHFMDSGTRIIAMAKPQFEARHAGQKHKGVIKNDAMRRKVLKELEQWVKSLFVIEDKADSEVSGSKGNVERFYLLNKAK